MPGIPVLTPGCKTWVGGMSSAKTRFALLPGHGERANRFQAVSEPENAGGICGRTLSSALQPGEQAGRVPALAAHLLDLGIERVDQSGDREARAIAPRFGQTNRQILAHPFQPKAEIQLAVVQGLV